MTIKTFWTIFLKILGFWLAFDSVSYFTGFFLGLFHDISHFDENDYPLFAIFFFAIVIYTFILWLLVFRTTWLIDKLRLDKGFVEERLELNIQRSTVLTIAVIIIGGLMLIDSLPQLCRLIFIFFQQNETFRKDPKSSFIILHLVRILLGCFLLTKSKFIVTFIDRPQTNENDIHE